MPKKTEKEKLEEIADACNELCVVLETGLINVDFTKLDYVQKTTLQRLREAQAVLAKNGF